MRHSRSACETGSGQRSCRIAPTLSVVYEGGREGPRSRLGRAAPLCPHCRFFAKEKTATAEGATGPVGGVNRTSDRRECFCVPAGTVLVAALATERNSANQAVLARHLMASKRTAAWKRKRGNGNWLCLTRVVARGSAGPWRRGGGDLSARTGDVTRLLRRQACAERRASRARCAARPSRPCG